MYLQSRKKKSLAKTKTPNSRKLSPKRLEKNLKSKKSNISTSLLVASMRIKKPSKKE